MPAPAHLQGAAGMAPQREYRLMVLCMHPRMERLQLLTFVAQLQAGLHKADPNFGFGLLLLTLPFPDGHRQQRPHSVCSPDR